MPKNVYTQKEIQKELLKGAALLADSVKITLGPKGRNAVLDRSPAGPLVTNDGAAIAKEMEPEGAAAAMGVRILKEASLRTGELSGGGATTTVVLAAAMIREGYRNLAAGASPVELRKGIQGAAGLAAESIRRLARPVKTREVVERAAVSSSDPETGRLVAEALERVGADGVITVEESGTLHTVLDVSEGIEFNRGYLSAEMITDNEAGIVELTDPYILITDEKITDARRLFPLLEQLAAGKRPLLLIADGLEGEARALLLTNIMRGTIKAAAVNAPAYGDGRQARLSDLAVLTGAVFVSEEMGVSLPRVTLDMLGRAAYVRADRNSTAIFGGRGDQEAIRIHTEALKKRIGETDYDFERDQLKERLSKLSGAAASIRVGAATETEMKEWKLRVEAALRSARAAMEEGIVPGGGAAYIHVQPAIRAYMETLSGDRRTGAGIVLRALEEPLRQIAENAGFFGGTILEQIREQSAGTGFDVLHGRFVPMIEAGIMDPAKVSRTALLSAASASAVFLTASAGVTEV